MNCGQEKELISKNQKGLKIYSFKELGKEMESLLRLCMKEDKVFFANT